MKKVNIPRGQNTSDKDDREVKDLNSSQIKDNGITEENDGDDYISDCQDIDTAVQDDQMSRASQDDNYHTAINDDNLDDIVHFGNPVTQPFLSRSVRIPTTEVGCLRFTQGRLFKIHSNVSRILTSIPLTITS